LQWKEAEEMDLPAKVLIIDDDWDFIEISRFSLEAKGYRVFSAESAEEGWKVLEKEKPDLILMDLMMEDLDSGVVLSRKIKSHPQYAAIPILMLTSIARETGMEVSPRSAEDLRHLNVDDFGTKPLKSKLLLEKVEKLLSRRKDAGP
jgi:CheY-like chemotaxis protein